ncbi:MAG: VTT domain-containing protein [Rhodobacteraceae bacterium]|nr:VTT domain-containing protein [Paracoccaceae bacterium]
MTTWLLSLVPVYGAYLVFAATFLSCLALPIPSSLIMLAAGAFTATGDLALTSAGLAALAGALAGDQTGYGIGRLFGAGLLARLETAGARGKALARARRLLSDRAGMAVFLSRWLFSPVGPWLNLVAGAGRFHWLPFTLAGIGGEAVWVGLYVGMGRLFAANLEWAGDMISSALGLVAGLTALVGLGLWLRHALKERAA